MNSQPKINLKWSRNDYWLEGLTLMILLISLVYLVYNYSVLPEMMPTHTNVQGKIDGMGNKNHLWILYFVFFLLYMFMTVINKYPHHFNYLSPITESNALQQYTSYTRIMRMLKLIVSIIFGAILFFSIKSAL